jgi:hypothetical protein
VILDDACASTLFAADAYLQQRRDTIRGFLPRASCFFNASIRKIYFSYNGASTAHPRVQLRAYGQRLDGHQMDLHCCTYD